MRPAPVMGPAPTRRKPVWSCEARVVLITRLFGGGARAREIDDVSWLRSSAAKSALRAWWRAAHAQEFSSIPALRAREEELFGAPGTFDADGKPRGGPGPLEVVTESRLGAPPSDYHEPLSNPLNYALFPAQPMGQPAAKIAPASDQNWAAIKLISPSSDATLHEVYRESLRLWLTLGGAGSRTRRGAGAIASASVESARKLGLPTSLTELETFLRKYCQPRPVPAVLSHVFCLARSRRIFLGPLQSTGEEAQKKVLAVLRGARQDRPRPLPNRWGRSRWPEADAIRLKVNSKKAWAHTPDPANAGQYPRAALGLPIVMHFKDRWPVEPEEHQVLAAENQHGQWRKLERYSSPVLLRAVRVWDGKTDRYVPIVLFTDCTFPDTVKPLVTKDPKADVAARDVVTGYSIQAHADDALRRIEAAFEREPGFRALF